MFDCLGVGKATLFVFCHVFGSVAMIKSIGSLVQFCVNAAVNPRFLVGEGFNSPFGYNITDALANKLARESAYSSM